MSAKKYVEIKDSRYNMLDAIRGLAIVSMILFHAAWDVVYVMGHQWDWYQGKQSFIWQQSICWTFILIAGFCIPLSKHLFRRGLLVSLAGALITVVTRFVVPEDRIIFGVLTFLGAAMLFMWIFRRLLAKIPPVFGILLNAVLFVGTRFINDGYLGIWDRALISLPDRLYYNSLYQTEPLRKILCYVPTALGFTNVGFWSTDYFSFFPWIFLFLIGFFLCNLMVRTGILEAGFFRWKVPLFSWIGRHSLIIYLLHQPVLYGLVIAAQYLGF